MAALSFACLNLDFQWETVFKKEGNPFRRCQYHKISRFRSSHGEKDTTTEFLCELVHQSCRAGLPVRRALDTD